MMRRIWPPKVSAAWLAGIVLAAAVICSFSPLARRWRIESADSSVAIISDFRELLPLIRQAGLELDDALEMLKERGLRGLMVSELTGDDAANGIGYAEILNAALGESEGTYISALPRAPENADKWITMRLTPHGSAAKPGPVHLPLPSNMMKNVGIIPDIDGLEAARRAGLAVFYRPAPTMGTLVRNASDALRAVASEYRIAAFAPSGEIVPGYPDVELIASVSREMNIPVAMVEFSRQLGASALNSRAAPLLLPLHSVTNEELMARNISRSALIDRLVRAALERSVRLLMLRPAPQNMGISNFSSYADEVSELSRKLTLRGFNMAWPEPIFAMGGWGVSPAASFSLSAVFLLTLWSFAVRMGIMSRHEQSDSVPRTVSRAMLRRKEPLSVMFIIAFLALLALLSAAVWRLPSAARLIGALTAPLVVTEASLLALGSPQSRNTAGELSVRIAASFAAAVIGGLAVASFFSLPSYMLRLSTFSGVKLTLMLPPLLVLIHDLRSRIHPESLTQIASRPPLWGELMLCGVLLLGLALMVFRSDNVAFIPGFEANIRESLERWLIARPRTREVFIGWPSLLILAFLMRKNLWEKYREVFRIGVVLGFSSIVNSFCHFHTPLAFILLREFNGLWTGVLLGIAAAAAVRFAGPALIRAVRPLCE